MAVSCMRLCTRHVSTGLQVCGYATHSKAPRPQEKTISAPVFQYVGQHKKPTHKVFVWGFSFTGALGIPSFVVPDSGRKTPRKYQLTPYRLETAEQISSAACGYGFTLIASRTKDVIKLWGMGLNKDSQLGFQRTQHSRLLQVWDTTTSAPARWRWEGICPGWRCSRSARMETAAWPCPQMDGCTDGATPNTCCWPRSASPLRSILLDFLWSAVESWFRQHVEAHRWPFSTEHPEKANDH